MRILVVGARGFVGVELVRELLARGHEVIGLEVRGDMGRLTPLADRITWITGDCSKQETILQAIGPRGVDGIYYGPFFRDSPGARSLSGEWEVMGRGALDIFNLAYALPIKRILFPSSTAVHGVQPADGALLDETSRARPFMVYGATKLLCEYFAGEVNGRLGANRIVCVRLPAVYGPGADIASRGVNIIPVQAARKDRAQVAYVPDARICVAHVGDTARFLADLFEAEAPRHTVYDLGGPDVSFADIANAVLQLCPDADIAFGSDTQMPLPNAVSCKRAADEFGLVHRSLADGVRSIVEYETEKRGRRPA
ncbi:NAD-dependent epimerase/dehydratase family protein [Flavisphingomonas formosensis]|uniref:NAD-dependent epimerase/dehydratase family protein n=1 Tax=Flavisphingomonas formosensis TaxID=861534 RepID=UPI0012F760EC|nr:NAD(P)-dependent oxidoreductase [Sphingomonas formosensis]